MSRETTGKAIDLVDVNVKPIVYSEEIKPDYYVGILIGPNTIQIHSLINKLDGLQKRDSILYSDSLEPEKLVSNIKYKLHSLENLESNYEIHLVPAVKSEIYSRNPEQLFDHVVNKIQQLLHKELDVLNLPGTLERKGKVSHAPKRRRRNPSEFKYASDTHSSSEKTPRSFSNNGITVSDTDKGIVAKADGRNCYVQ